MYGRRVRSDPAADWLAREGAVSLVTGLQSRTRGVLSSRWLRLCVGIGLLALVLYWVDLRTSLAIVADARLDYLALLLLVLVADRLIAALRWWLLVHGNSAAVTFSGIVRLVFISGFAGYFTPGSIGVEAVRVYGLSRTTSNLAVSVTSVFVERVLALLALTLLVLVGLALQPPGLPSGYERLAWLALAVLIVSICALMSRGCDA